ncbi:MAG: dTDP-4-dehydrorhamnose 3,5-epimerase [Gaiellaceae bacterium]|jgi:dTDP-4-dehydrorhamnose 3,5-epimerase|nr:dTDP-4-dehydrorhamnose 3,5-epimerase [Gaiellaceae bacterium]
MIFTPLELDGAFVVDLELREDERGFFARTWAREEFEAHGLDPALEQCNLSFNHRRGTLRGLHFQREPHAEAKLIRCTRGAILDVIVDLRPDSSTHTQWIGVELSADNRRALYVPEGFAHGYQTLVDATETQYQVSEAYAPAAEGGVRWNDPAFGIEWPPADELVISDKDRSWPDYELVRTG